MSELASVRDKIVAHDISLTYTNEANGSHHTVLDRFDLKVRDGEFLAVLGPSGCGKSTFLSILAGLVPQTSGSVTVDGEPVGAARQKLGLVFQGYALFPWRTVRKNVETGLEIRGVARVRATQRSRKVPAARRAARFRRSLSAPVVGRHARQRVAIARVLAYGPEILLMDEPFGRARCADTGVVATGVARHLGAERENGGVRHA